MRGWLRLFARTVPSLVFYFLKVIFIKIYVTRSLGECERREPKGLYKKVKAGEISYPYESLCNKI
ncbi:adenylyl-sulfate kinase [Metabacillus dongyingensis]|uniref:adenylyl-sulfate kinase n=1 Tax=Metabacillus dongyingensis TaxID=2874282 RepID=UPI003B8DB4D8